MGVHIHKDVVNGVEKEVEVVDMPHGKGLTGYHYNYLFVINTMAADSANWNIILYRPGAQRHFRNIKKERGHIITQAIKAIEVDYKQRVAVKTKK